MKNAMIILGLIVFQLQTINAQNIKVLKDQYNRPILTEDNQRISYPYEANLQLPLLLETKTTKSVLNQDDIIMDCEYGFAQTVMGTSIGQKAMIHEDIDNDGDIDLIITAGSNGYNSTTFWYILEYNEESGEYYQSYVNTYGLGIDERVEVLNVYDRDNDGLKEIFEITNHHLNVYHPITFELIQSVEIDNDSYEAINSIEFCNVDNDPEVEIIFCNEHKTMLYTLDDLSLKREFNYYAKYLKAGDVDGDGINEIIYSNGNIVQLDPISEEIEWDFLEESNSEGHIELSDVDEDGILEIAFAADWHIIRMIDADIQSDKFNINVSSDIDALSMYDINNDGVEELIYGEGQWGYIRCINSLDGSELWSIDKEKSGTGDLGIADTDKDGDLEIFWSSGSSYLFIHDLLTLDFEYQSKHIEGPFHAIQVVDLDGDGTNEIISISTESGSGDESGVLSVFNSETNDIIFQSDGSYFGNVWTGLHAVKVADVDNDQKLEIVVAAGQTYSGRIWIIDGQDFSIQSDQIYGYDNGDIDEFTCFDLGDVDQDGIIEIMASSDGNLYQISTEDLSIEWFEEENYSNIRNIIVEDLNNDGQLEVIVSSNHIKVYDGTTHQKWETSEAYFRNFDIIDWDNDGLKDIISVSNSGDIIMFDAYSDQRTTLLETNLDNIYSIKAENLISDASIELIYTNDAYLYVSSPIGKTYRSKKLGREAGKYDGLQIADQDNDGAKEIFVGTNFNVVEFSQSCFECVDFAIELEPSDLTCLPEDDGSIEVILIGGSSPYSYSWNNGSQQQNLSNLSPGVYSLVVTDHRGCVYEKTDNVNQSILNTTAFKTNVGCYGEEDGRIDIIIDEGHPPYNYHWNNGNDTSFQENLAIGNYQITVSDSKLCEEIHEIEIEQGEVNFGLSVYDIICHGDDNANAQVYSIHGESPFEIAWSTGSNEEYVYQLGVGDYSVTITDSLNCSFTKTFDITEPDTIILSSSTTIDNPDTPLFEGTATVYVSGGIAPYFFRWDDALHQTEQTAYNLPLGEVNVRVTDSKGCSAYHTARVWTGLEDRQKNQIGVSIYPNPIDNQIFIDFEKRTDLDVNEVSLFDELGRKISLTKSEFYKTSNSRYYLDLSKLKKGLYFINIKDEQQDYTTKFLKN